VDGCGQDPGIGVVRASTNSFDRGVIDARRNRDRFVPSALAHRWSSGAS
jgi:hypothetical protein